MAGDAVNFNKWMPQLGEFLIYFCSSPCLEVQSRDLLQILGSRWNGFLRTD